MAGQDYYGTLGVKRDASEKDIKSAFRRLARRFHPDINPGNAAAEKRFKEINEAHEILGDPDSRRKYDKYGDNWMHADRIEEMQGSGGFRSGPGMGGGFGHGSGGIGGIGDIFGQFFGADRGDGMFRGRAQRPPQPRELSVEITLKEAFQGTQRSMRVADGAGGTRNIEATIPAGVDTGSRIRMSGAAAESQSAAGADLVLKVDVKSDPKFRRNGADLTTDINVSMFDALLGGEVIVPTIAETGLALRIPPETQNGQTFRLAGKGMPRLHGTGSGDLFAKVFITLPEDLQDSERELLEQLRGIRESAGGVP